MCTPTCRYGSWAPTPFLGTAPELLVSNSHCPAESHCVSLDTRALAYEPLLIVRFMKVFLTGATGFVGSHLLRRLLRDGHHIRALVRSGSSLLSADSGTLEQVNGDLNSKDLTRQVAGCDAVIN